MLRFVAVLAVLLVDVAGAAGPTYSADRIVSATTLAQGPLAPNSYVSIFGKDLAWGEEALTADRLAGGLLPTTLGDVRVYVANYAAPLFYAGPAQINFLIPGNLKTGDVPLRVVRQGVTGPEVTIRLVDAAPQLFPWPDNTVIAQHVDYRTITPEDPARPGEIIVLYANGLGTTEPNPAAGEVPWYPGLMTHLGELQVFIGGAVLSPDRILYAGLTPGWPGLYQINLILPDSVAPDPDIRVAVGSHSSPAGLKLAVR